MSHIQHKHLIVRAEVQDPPKDPKYVEQWMRDLINLIDMKVVIPPRAAYVDKPGNVGVTGIAGIETSHIALHVWEETDPPLMQLDVYTCGEMNHHIVFLHMKQFIPTKLEYLMLDREKSIDRMIFKEDEEHAARKETTDE